jgi:hypothetical protein
VPDDNSDLKSKETLFEIGLPPGWTVVEAETGESDETEKLGSGWSLVLAREEDTHRESLRIFISLDSSKLLKQREWQMALGQEISKVRFRAVQFLQNHRKSGT